MKRLAFIWLAGVLAAGCATSTIETRRNERAAAFATLLPELRDLANKGRIKVGMSMDAVYVAWGKPSQILTGENSDGITTIWRYQINGYQERRYWSHDFNTFVRNANGYSTPRMESSLKYDYVPFTYLAAEVLFEQGVVKSWQNMSQQKP